MLGSWNCGSSPSPSRAPATTSCSPSPAAPRTLGYGAFFRSDHYLMMGDGERRARPHRRVDHAGRAGPGDQPHPARHADDRRDLPAARPAGDHGGAGRPDERRPGGAGHRHRLVRRGAHRVRHPVPAAGRAVRPAGGAARRDHRAVGHADRASGSTTPAGTTRSRTRPPCPSPCSSRAHRSCSAGRARSALLGWPPATPTSSTCRSPRCRTRRRSSTGSARPAPRSAGTRPGWSGPTPWCCAAGGTTPRWPAGPPPSAANPTSCGPTVWPGPPPRSLDTIGRYAEIGSERIYLQVLDLGDLEHLELVASEVMAKL